MPEPDLPWCVMRLDDNGNTVVIKRLPTREQAQTLADQFEARGHKQMYWIERR